MSEYVPGISGFKPFKDKYSQVNEVLIPILLIFSLTTANCQQEQDCLQTLWHLYIICQPEM